METKRCTRCGVEKPLEMFCKDKKTKDGLNFWCRECVKKYLESIKDKKSEMDKRYREKNKEKRGKGIGNGWTVDVIAHILKGVLNNG